MKFIESPTEQTTAITDLILGVLALAAALYLRQFIDTQPWKANLWSWAFGLLALASFLGALVHGLKMPEANRARLWRPLFLTLGLLVALFVGGAIYDVWGLATAQSFLPVMLVAGGVFWTVTLIWPDSFLLFVIYESAAMLFALGGYVWLASAGRLEGAGWMAAGIAVTIIAAVVQTRESILITLIWPFDNNGLYHLIQIVGIALLVIGLRAGLLAGGLA